MNISIKSYQTSIPAKAPAQEGLRSENTTKSTTENTNSSTAATVSISSSAQARYIQSSAIERQTSMSQSELKSLYAKGQKDIYNFGHLIAGGSYNKDDLLPKTDDPARLTLGQKSLDWAIGLSQSPPKHLSNPFAAAFFKVVVASTVFSGRLLQRLLFLFPLGVECHRPDGCPVACGT